MIESAIEEGLVMTRLRLAVDDAGLRAHEAEHLIGLGLGCWNDYALGRPLHRMTKLQETRARLTLDLLQSLASLRGGWSEVGPWLRGGDTPEASPLSWAGNDLERLRALSAAAREEVR